MNCWYDSGDTVTYQIAADVLLVIHVLFVAFVVMGFLLIFVGIVCRWSWIRSFWLRCFHLMAIVLVVTQAWLGELCPLTVWENNFRQAAGQGGYSGTFIEHWLQRIIFYDFAPWVFVVVYTFFGVLGLIAWGWVPPRWPRRLGRRNADS
jgi:hypothetical protein